MVTQDSTRTTIQEEPKTALLPTYPQQDNHPQRDSQLHVTPTPPGAKCDGGPAVTDAAAIMAVQPPTHNVTSPCNAIDRAALQQRIQEALTTVDRFPTAGSLCTDCQQDTVCSTCLQCHYCNDITLPCAAALHRRIAQTLAVIDQRHQTRVGGEDDRGSGWFVIRPGERDDNGGSASSATRLPSFQGPPRTGGAAASVSVARQAKPLQEVLACR